MCTHETHAKATLMVHTILKQICKTRAALCRMDPPPPLSTRNSEATRLSLLQAYLQSLHTLFTAFSSVCANSGRIKSSVLQEALQRA